MRRKPPPGLNMCLESGYSKRAKHHYQKPDYWLLLSGEFQLWLESGARCQPYQQVHAESVDLSSLQIRHACLSHSKYLGGFSLRHTAFFQPMLQSHQQHRAHLHLGRFFGREKIVKDTAPRRRHVTRAMFTVRNLLDSHNFTLQSL
jgi:hypothetical protein